MKVNDAGAMLPIDGSESVGWTDAGDAPGRKAWAVELEDCEGNVMRRAWKEMRPDSAVIVPDGWPNSSTAAGDNWTVCVASW